MDKLMSDYKQEKQKLAERYKTEEYQKNCQHFILERDRLVKLVERYLSKINQHKSDFEAAVVHTEYASGCKCLHRGYYCPSLIQDVVVGNVRRGKLLKRLTTRTKTCWEYGFNAERQLIRCEHLITKTVADEECLAVDTREFLFYEENRIYGITVRSDGTLEAITEEIFQNGKCICYTYCLCTSFNGVIRCGDIRSECYTYGADVMQAQWHRLIIPLQETLEFAKTMGWSVSSCPIYRKDQYLFEKKDGKFILAENN